MIQGTRHHPFNMARSPRSIPKPGESLGDLYPDLVQEWHTTKNECTPFEFTQGSNFKAWWKCLNAGHEWQAIIKSRSRMGTGCPHCPRPRSGNSIPTLGRTLADVHPELAAEWHPTKNEHPPTYYKPGSSIKVWWKCLKSGHEWPAVIYSRSRNGNGCPHCPRPRPVNAIPEPGKSLAETHPELAAEWHPTKNEHPPSHYRPGSGTKVWWKCPVADDHEWKVSPHHRTGPRKSGCPCCSNPSFQLSVTNRLDTLYPEIAAEWHPTKNEKGPDEYFAMSNSKVWWLCPKCGNEYHAWISNRVNVRSGCSSCHGGALHSDGRNSLAVVAPEVAAEWHPTKNEGLTPDKIRPSSGIRAWWLCSECGHEWETAPNHRVDGEGDARTGCNVCGMRRTAEALRSSKDEVIERCLEVHDSKYSYPWEDVEYENAQIRMPIICPEHGLFKQSMVTHMYRGSGCPSCAQHGFDPSKPGTYYVIEIRNEEGAVILYKGGKTGDIETRVDNHESRFSKHQRSSGWTLQLIDTLDFEIGIGAEELEGLLLKAVDIRAPSIEDLSSELFLHNPLDYAREKGWV